VVQKFKDVGDLSSLGLLDRQIGLLKQKLTEMHGRTKKSWATNLQGHTAPQQKNSGEKDRGGDGGEL
jgi:hypothetical protein